MARPTLHQGNELTDQQIDANYEFFMEYLKEKFSGDRLEKLLKLYAEDNYGLRASLAPASTFQHFHNAHIGGYLQHVMNVDKASAGAAKLFEAMGGEIDFTEEERCMAALSHDLGKLGPKEGEYYLPQTEEWAIKKRGQMFMMNPKIQHWDVTDLALFILQEYGINLTWKETMAIKLSDGVFADKNKPYYINNSDDGRIRTSLPNVIHWGDWIACRAENSVWHQARE
jgi:hypothetical protein